MTTKLSEKFALVTGGTVGSALPQRNSSLEKGAIVLITGRRKPPLDVAVKEISEGVSAVGSDVANLEGLDRSDMDVCRDLLA